MEEKDLSIETKEVKHDAGRTLIYDKQNGILGRVQRFAGRFGVEQRGIERVLPDERTDTSVSKVGTLWMSANMTVSTFALGALAQPVFGLGFVDAALTVICINILGILPVSFFSTFGPRFGLRQMVVSRFFFGYYGVKLIAIFNILACLGWSAVNVIVGAQLLSAINPGPHALPGWAGVLIIALSTLLITTFGYRLVHAYERWSWVPVLVIFCIVAGEFGASGNFAVLPLSSGKAEAGSVLSFAASVFGFATGWTSMAADYAVYQPETRPRRAVFLWTFGGLLFPLVFTELLGAAVMTAYAVDEGYAEAYDTNHIGGVLAMVLVPRLGGFGRFCLAVLALSIVANNCPNIYSVSLSLQVLTRQTQRIPRFVWPALATAVYVAISIPGYGSFEEVLENFMLLIGYWLAIYEGIALTEHFVFRRTSGYAVDDYATPDKLPPGYSALCAFLFGVMGAVLGMAQSWYVGPIGRLCGDEYGGDVGFELAFGFSAFAYLVLRSVEKKWFKR
ncbi:NCS1 nucleoside transporter [Diaporthe helianthi]|uniref:NCS1 nucleoside transporter n=1 Tax=Diaporthe helianthi TaxID=158607 RepID=A0A2P5I8I3_DIAHE|nr:NCS1 nucleoside transporter [Diaporthe helianthi]